MAGSSAAMIRAEQRLHRDELKLARLKNRQNKKRQQDTRLKLRLGGLCYLVEWDQLSEAELEKKVLLVCQELESSDNDSLKIQGSNLLNLIMANKIRSPASSLIDPDVRREAIHQQITKGGMLVKHGLENVPKATLLGAIFSVSEFTEFTQVIERKLA